MQQKFFEAISMQFRPCSKSPFSGESCGEGGGDVREEAVSDSGVVSVILI